MHLAQLIPICTFLAGAFVSYWLTGPEVLGAANHHNGAPSLFRSLLRPVMVGLFLCGAGWSAFRLYSNYLVAENDAAIAASYAEIFNKFTEVTGSSERDAVAVVREMERRGWLEPQSGSASFVEENVRYDDQEQRFCSLIGPDMAYFREKYLTSKELSVPAATMRDVADSVQRSAEAM